MKEEVSFEAIKEIFTEYLKEHKHRKTPERYAILERINGFEGHNELFINNKDKTIIE